MVESLDRTRQKVEEGKATLVSEDKSSRETSEPDAKSESFGIVIHGNENELSKLFSCFYILFFLASFIC